MGANLDAAYSNVCKVNVTPYLIDMSYLNILSADKDAVTTYLYSANKDGIYTGYMCASAWMNFWAKENDGTVWGNTPIEGKAFVIDNRKNKYCKAGTYTVTVKVGEGVI